MNKLINYLEYSTDIKTYRLLRYNKKYIADIMIYQDHFQDLLPLTLSVNKNGQKNIYTKGNVMKHSDMLQIVYSSDEWGVPGDLEIDLYFVQNGDLKIGVDVTYGDLMVLEFSLERPNQVHLTYKVDDFSLEEKSLADLLTFLNQLDFNLSTQDFDGIDIIY